MSDALKRKIQEDYKKLAPHYHTDKSPVWQGVRDLVSVIHEGDNVLDLGCGTGRISQAVPENCTYLGIDISPELIAVAQDLFPTRTFQVGDAEVLDFESSTFDTVLSIAVIHHYTKKVDRIALLQEIYRVLKKDGVLCITVWNLAQKRYLNRWRGWRKAYISNSHDTSIRRLYYAYSKGGFAKELKQAGFRVEMIKKEGNNIVACVVK